MDEENSKVEVKHTEQRYPNTIHLGAWEIEINHPLGFVVRNCLEKEEYHFCRDSNGWITGVYRGDPNHPVINTLNSRGAKGLFAPVMCDVEAAKQAGRRLDLIDRFKNKTITAEEKEELLKIEHGVV